MFDLDQAIVDWRQQMLADGIKTPLPLEEMESQLRDNIEQQMKSGLSETEAFKTAVQKIGKAQVVQTEFAKVEDIKKQRQQKLMEILFVVVSFLIPLVIGRKVNFSAMTSGQQISSLAAIATFSLLICGGRLCYGVFPVIPAKRIRNAIACWCCVPLALWWVAFLWVIEPGYDFTMIQFTVAFLWGFLTPAGICLGLVFGIETAAAKFLRVRPM